MMAFVILLGVVPPNMFDRLQTASFLGGYNASISSNMPAMSHYVSTGKDPFVAVYTAVEVRMVFFYACSFLQSYNITSESLGEREKLLFPERGPKGKGFINFLNPSKLLS